MRFPIQAEARSNGQSLYVTRHFEFTVPVSQDAYILYVLYSEYIEPLQGIDRLMREHEQKGDSNITTWSETMLLDKGVVLHLTWEVDPDYSQYGIQFSKLTIFVPIMDYPLAERIWNLIKRHKLMGTGRWFTKDDCGSFEYYPDPHISPLLPTAS